MISKSIISYFINKCSNDEIRGKLSGLSYDERKERLEGKMNPFEMEDYDSIVNQLDFYGMFEDDELSPSMVDDMKHYEDLLFEYDKRIYRGYDLDKNVGNVPDVDVNSFAVENNHDAYDDTIYPLEQSQINAQQELTQYQQECLMAYFGNDYKDINGELMNNSYWRDYDDGEKRFLEVHNKSLRDGMDSSIRDSPGLLQDTMLFHGTGDSQIVNIHNRIGDKINFKPYISTSYNEEVGESYKGDSGFLVKFLTPKGTKGICANDTRYGELSEFQREHEYLLGRGNKGTIVDIDYDNREFFVLLE